VEPDSQAIAHPVSESDGELHARLLSGDPTAPSDLAIGYLDKLVRALHAIFPRVDEQLLETAAIDALLELAQRPERYDSSRGTLAGYLRMSARGDVLNALRSEQRRRAHHTPVEDVELAQGSGNALIEGPCDPAQEVLRTQPMSPQLAALIRTSFDQTEWQVVQLMLDGERRTSEYAAVLGIAKLPEIERVRVVKQTKDRLHKRLQRLAPRVQSDG
jgi:DNA-directed RNA polymerase specialized sigma24 family protein